MGIFEKMIQLTQGKSEEENDIIEVPRAKDGDTIKGIITNIIYEDKERNKKGGFGFILSDALPFERIFFHWSGLRQDTLRFLELQKKMKVEFVLKYSEPNEEHEGGYRAIKIRVIK